MSHNLVIVESPAKAKTIEKYLGKDYEVLASYGHVRDLVPKEGAVDTENGFAMRYDVIERNAKHVNKIAQALTKSDALFLATDPDREGEAIAWHLLELLREKGKLKDKPVKRVVFHEITKKAVSEAIANPRDISESLVNAQQARRALDYLVGFNLSPLLWRKIQRGLSAGRVQSPALRLICERDAEIEAFDPREYWKIEARTTKDEQKFGARLYQFDGKKVEQFTVTNDGRAADVEKALREAANGQLDVRKVDKKQRKRNPSPPFTTSTLQQEASRKLGFTAVRTMRTAQQLYEGIELGGETVGLITYMRTDSVTLSNDALAEIRDAIKQRYGDKALPDAPRAFKTKSKNAQEAHEAIRPSAGARGPEDVKSHLNSDQNRLYELIWQRTMACQMIHATFDTVAADLYAGPENDKAHIFRASGQTLRDPGFLAVYQEGQDEPDDSDDDKRLPSLTEGEKIPLEDILTTQHFTEPPPRFTEASLVKTLEEYDIGRPSTYASIISTLQNREYVDMDGKAFMPTPIGKIVNKFLTEHFSRYVDYEFTAKLEDQLDAVSRGESEWQPLLEDFWKTFSSQIESKQDLTREEVAQARELGTDPESGKPVIVRIGKYGPFVQIGSKDDEEKPKFAGLRPGQDMDKITLDEAMVLFTLPRDLGETPEGEEMQVNVGRFGPYVRYGKKFASIKEDDPYTLGYERALEIVAEKKEADVKKMIKVFDDSNIRVQHGPYGPYVTDGKKNAKIPKDREPESLTFEECEELIAKAPERKARGKKGGRKKPAKASTKPAKKGAKSAKVSTKPAKASTKK